MPLCRKRQGKNSYISSLRMKNVGFCFYTEKIYDKMSKSLESKVLERWIYGKYIQGYR